MNIRTLPLLLAITASLTTHTGQAATGTLRFEGQVDGGTCSLAAGDVNRTIKLLTVKVPDFDASDHVAAHDFEVSANCESGIRHVTFLFAGTPSIGNGTLFANTGTSGGTALWLKDRATLPTTIPANGTAEERSRTVATSSNKAVLPLTAAYHKTGETVTKGTLLATVTLSITYN